MAATAIGLAGLWRVDLGQTDSGLALGLVQDGQRVAVGDADDPTGDLGRGGGVHQRVDDQHQRSRLPERR